MNHTFQKTLIFFKSEGALKLFLVSRINYSRQDIIRFERPCYLSKVDHDRKMRSRKQKTDIGKYSFVNRSIQLWNQLPADVLGTLSCKPSNFRKRVRKVINKVKLGRGIIEKAVK
jgi:hypothetical protein